MSIASSFFANLVPGRLFGSQKISALPRISRRRRRRRRPRPLGRQRLGGDARLQPGGLDRVHPFNASVSMHSRDSARRRIAVRCRRRKPGARRTHRQRRVPREPRVGRATAGTDRSASPRSLVITLRRCRTRRTARRGVAGLPGPAANRSSWIHVHVGSGDARRPRARPVGVRAGAVAIRRRTSGSSSTRSRSRTTAPRPVQLLTRHWIITDGTGHVEEVRGPGVVGKQPILEARRVVHLHLRLPADDAVRRHGRHLPDGRRRAASSSTRRSRRSRSANPTPSTNCRLRLDLQGDVRRQSQNCQRSSLASAVAEQLQVAPAAGSRSRRTAPGARVDPLRVEQHEAARAQPIDQRDQRHLRRVGDAVEHRLAEERAAERDAVEAADQRAVLPRLDRVREARPRAARSSSR